MAAESYYHLNAYPASSEAPPPGTYSGHDYNTAPPKLQPETYSGHDYNPMPPRPLSPPVKPNTQLLGKPNTTSSHTTPNDRLKQRKYQKLKRYLRIGKTIVQAISTLLSAIMFGSMVFMCIKFYDTQNEIRGGRTAWPKHSKVWPTFMLLIGAGLTLIVSIITLISYCCFLKKAKRSWKLTVLKYVIHIGAWAVITILYRYEKDANGSNNDLWGWTCSEEADAIQAEFNDVVGFSSLCNLQVSRQLIAWLIYLTCDIVKLVVDLASRIPNQVSVRSWTLHNISKNSRWREAVSRRPSGGYHYRFHREFLLNIEKIG